MSEWHRSFHSSAKEKMLRRIRPCNLSEWLHRRTKSCCSISNKKSERRVTTPPPRLPPSLILSPPPFCFSLHLSPHLTYPSVPPFHVPGPVCHPPVTFISQDPSFSPHFSLLVTHLHLPISYSYCLNLLCLCNCVWKTFLYGLLCTFAFNVHRGAGTLRIRQKLIRRSVFHV